MSIIARIFGAIFLRLAAILNVWSVADFTNKFRHHDEGNPTK